MKRPPERVRTPQRSRDQKFQACHWRHDPSTSQNSQSPSQAQAKHDAISTLANAASWIAQAFPISNYRSKSFQKRLYMAYFRVDQCRRRIRAT